MIGPKLLRAALSAREGYLDTLEALVRLESPSDDKAALARLASWLHDRLTTDGWHVERLPDGDGEILLATVDGGDGPKTLLLCHYDTVYPMGTLSSMPYRVDGDMVHGPGVLDMKAGITTAMHAVLLARTFGSALIGPVALLLSADEETGSHRSREHIERVARTCERVLVLEPGRDDGALKTGRKGVGALTATFHGLSAHAGNDPAKGASALAELARFIPYVERLADPALGTTVNVTLARGGTASNVIAEQAEAAVDVRVASPAEAERVEAAARAYLPADPRVEVRVRGGLNRPPLEPTPANGALFEHALKLGERLGLALEGQTVGGGSDGSFTSALGVATLDGLGAVGAGPHARHEHIRVTPTLERLALVTALLTQP